MKKNIMLKIFCFIMICCFSFLFISCGYDSPPEGEEGSELGGQTEEMENLYGVKVLYRPLDYDYDVGSGAEPGQKNEYYGKYAFYILYYLYNIYGIPNATIINNIFKIQNAPAGEWTDKTFPEGEQDTRTLTFNYNYLPYLYDSIRYKVDTYGKVVGQIKEEEDVTSEDFTEYDLVGADVNTAWEWSFQYNNETYPSFVSTYNIDFQANNHIYTNSLSKNTVGNYYNENNYTDVYLGSNSVSDSEHYSDFVKALEYVIYSYALDLEPNAVLVNTRGNASNPYTVQINGYNTVDEALQARKDLFKKAGSFVGLATRQINKISTWIKTNVIGIDANNSKDSFTSYDKLYEVLNEEDAVIGYQPAPDANISTFEMGRAYDKAVDEIIKYVCRYATIGKEGGGDLTVDNRFLASEVIEYAGTTFYANSDAFFPKYDPTSSLSNRIRPLEYQSAVLMPRGERYLQAVTLTFKYDADLDGTDPSEGFNTDKFIDIQVELNYYNASKNKVYKLSTKQTRVYDGSFVWGCGPNMNDGFYSNVQANHGMVELNGFKNNSELQADGLLYAGSYIHLGAFDTSILPTDLADRNYKLYPYVSKNPLTLLGTTDVRKYYKLLEPSTGDNLEENQTYISGCFNEKMVEGKCDYLEIVYKVLKDKNDLTKNYNFYTGISMIDSSSLKYQL